MPYDWKPQYLPLVGRYLKKHFGSAQGLTLCFPYMKAAFKLKNPGPLVDVRTYLKSNHEYHCLERYARQYHVVGAYEEASEHWLIAACWRHETMFAHHVLDEPHFDAVRFALRNFRYNQELHRWQRGRRRLPRPHRFGLAETILDKKDQEAEGQLARVYGSV